VPLGVVAAWLSLQLTGSPGEIPGQQYQPTNRGRGKQPNHICELVAATFQYLESLYENPRPSQAVRQLIVLWGYLQSTANKLTEMAIGAGSDEMFYPHLLLSSGDITRFSLNSLLHRPD